MSQEDRDITDELDHEDELHAEAEAHIASGNAVPAPAPAPATPAPIQGQKPRTDGRTYSNVLKVKADPKDILPEDRKRASKNLAGAIAHGLRQYGEVYLRCFSNATCGKASKAMAIARGFVAVQGYDLYCAPSFITANIAGQERTGICYWCFTNKTDVQTPPRDETPPPQQ